MKRMIKSIARAMWAGIGPVRRPLVRKFHLLMNDRHRSVVDEIDQRVAQHFHARSQFAESIVQELNLVLDSMVRELTRLQAQVEVLHQQIEEQSTGRRWCGSAPSTRPTTATPTRPGMASAP